ncbi:Endoplasmic reticulum resident protein 27 [Saguinus oedipus]|uniref:Endoplasmic reticulum resident protein 27 n=1 Tax=Saguinus oedipus TaxID=9490 RepID=A0ABQ9UW79_SAGOE|nr:Endoplasmic reticulum resident protein 27 [Saguinus oedipus]
MEAAPSRFMFLLFLLTCELAPEVAAEVEKSSDGPGASQEPTWLADVPAAMEFIAATEVAVIGFFQDLEIPAVSILHSMVEKFPGVSFGISTESEVLTHYNITGNTICLFRLVDNEQLNLEDEDTAGIDAAKLSNFIELNSLHMVTEYNPVKTPLFLLAKFWPTSNAIFISVELERTHCALLAYTLRPLPAPTPPPAAKRAGKPLQKCVASGRILPSCSLPHPPETLPKGRLTHQTAIGLFNSVIQIHLLLIMNKASPEYEENMQRYQKAAKLFQGKESQLPALAIYRTVDDEWDTLPTAEVSVEHVQNFCDGFLRGKLLKESHEADEKPPKVEL